MENQIYLDTSLFFWSVVFGFFCGVYYELFRILRKAFPHHPLLVAAEDLLFWIPVTFSYLLFSFAMSDGVIRWFSVFGSICGFLLYLKTVGRVISFFTDAILRALRAILFWIYGKTLRPLGIVFKKITNSLSSVIKRTVIIGMEKRKRRALEKKKRNVLISARGGFQK